MTVKENLLQLHQRYAEHHAALADLAERSDAADLAKEHWGMVLYHLKQMNDLIPGVKSFRVAKPAKRLQ